ncbi:metallopeptidase family protein [Iamia majanohamensis]|uniref:Metallopeptidase family protein n=1 Tax=Iamia majanohamensis TaxID=467976 RepID=A0AAE9Y3N2_9ACTN|nr:metallopeptidase family protein [Iamia majanohamensis]WCO65464.1 metallopeptidase family protein [Iamia majanohamensis]
MPLEVSRSRFEDLVEDALAGLPPEVEAMLDNVAVMVTDGHPGDPLGRYEGVPRTARGDYGLMEMPDRITIYRVPLCAHARDEDDLVREVRITVVHELGHHLGIDDDRLHELGYG